MLIIGRGLLRLPVPLAYIVGRINRQVSCHEDLRSRVEVVSTVPFTPTVNQPSRYHKVYLLILRQCITFKPTNFLPRSYAPKANTDLPKCQHCTPEQFHCLGNAVIETAQACLMRAQVRHASSGNSI